MNRNSIHRDRSRTARARHRLLPALMAGDVVQILTDPVAPVGDATTTANVVVTQPATDVGGTVVVKGTAQDAAGHPLPIGELQQRMISKTLFNINGRRDLRAPTD